MKTIIDILNNRQATRAISEEKLSDAIIGDLIEAARLTPSCFNNQPWRFLFLQSDEALIKGHEVLTGGNRAWAPKAPLLIIGYSRAEDDCQLKDGREYYQFDLGLSAMNIMLSATEQGLVARPMAGFDPDKVKELFNLEEQDEPLILIAVGYPTDDISHLPDYYKESMKKPRERKSAGEIVKIL